MIKAIYVVNLNSVLEMGFNLLKSVLSQETLQKVVTVQEGSTLLGEVIGEVELKRLYSDVGGNGNRKESGSGKGKGEL